MDFLTRFQSMKPEHKQALLQNLARIGDPNEILSYIGSIPILCPEGKGMLNSRHEVRLDPRFLVLCNGKRIHIFRTETLKFFFVSCSLRNPGKDDCYFGVSGSGEQFSTFMVDRRYAEPLFAACGMYFNGFETDRDFWLDRFVQAYEMDAGSILLSRNGFFRPKKERVPYTEIVSCRIRYNWDDTLDYYLQLRLRDGSVRELFSLNSCDDCYQMARTLKHFAPHMTLQLEG